MFIHKEEQKLPELKVTEQYGVRHYVTPDGNKYPSITTMLGAKEKPWLKDWRTALGETKADREQKRCADRGTAVHELIEQYLGNQTINTRGYKTEYVKGFNQLKFQLNRINNIRAQEAALYSDTLKLAGRVDCIGEYDGELAVIDFKTSNNPKDQGMVQDYYLQCTAYAIMWFERTKEPIENIRILMTVERGLVPLVFTEKIDKYVEPLLKRTDEYYRMLQNGR